jgi:PAS domain S-box-containing protein
LSRIKKESAMKDEKCKRFVKDAAVGIYEIKFNPPRFVWVNEEICRILGYSKEELLKMSPFDVTDEAGKRLFLERVKRHVAGKKVAPSAYYKITTKNGKKLWVVMHSTFTYDKGVVDGALVVAEDITARKMAEERLQESEARFRLVAEAAKVLVYELDLESGAVTVFRGLEELLGYKPGEVSLDNEWWMNQIHPDDIAAVEAKLNKAIETATDTLFEYRIRCKQGDYIVVHDTAKMVKDDLGKVVRIVGGARDVTERKKAEKELKEVQLDLNRAQAVAKTGSWRLDTQHNVLIWSDENHRIFGVPKGTPMTYETFLSLVHPEDRSYVDGKWKDGLRGKPYDIEHRIVVDREVKWVRERAELEFDNNGTLLGGFGTTQEITDLVKLRKKLEHSRLQIEEYANQMEALAQERAKKLKDAERMATIGATAGMVGHDIRNPLQAIIGDLYLIASDVASLPEGEEKESIKESVSYIRKNVDYIDKIIQDLQDYAKPLKPIVRETDFEDLCEDVLFKNGCQENVTVSFNVEKDARTLVTDPLLLKRILTNLVNNAVQAMPEGGKLEVHAYREPNEFVITIQDTGVGVPEELKEKLFTPLFTTKAKGQGFGLPVVKRLTESFGGKVAFESKEGKGTKFTVRFPTAKK